MTAYICTATDKPTTMFTVGEKYIVVAGKTGVRDDLGRMRYLGEAANFSIEVDRSGKVFLAHFKIKEHS